MTELLLDGVNHVGMVTDDIDRLTAFYRDVFGCTSRVIEDNDEITLTIIDIGPARELNVFVFKGDGPHFTRGDMFTNGALDHFGLQAKNKEAFDEIRRRLMAKGATDGFVTDFGMALSCYFEDPDGLGGEVLLPIAGATKSNPPGTKAEGYEIGVP